MVELPISACMYNMYDCIYVYIYYHMYVNMCIHLYIYIYVCVCVCKYQCSKLKVHPATGVHILPAGCMYFKPCAPGVCMLLYIQYYECLYIDICIHKDSRVHGFIYLCTRCVHGIIP